MPLEWLLDPISDDAPCGPDLDKTNDDGFVEYFFDAEARLPERYVIPGFRNDKGEGSDDKIFDPKSVDHRAERNQIEALLKKSRDTRLTVLLARWMMLAGRVDDAANAVEATVNILETFGDAAHPTISKSATNRRNALDELGNAIAMAIPLHYAGLIGTTEVTYRKYLVATGQSEAREGEEEIDPSTLTSALASPANREAVDACHGALSRIAAALHNINAICQDHETSAFSPQFGPTLKAISDVQEFISTGRGDLLPFSADDLPVAQAIAEADAPSGSAEGGEENTVTPAPQSANLSSLAVKSHDEAKAYLSSCETYFSMYEPSSAAFLLTTQARLLIGKSLIEALETLLPEHANRAIIDFGPETGFVIPMERMKSLANEAPRAPQPDGPAPMINVPNIANRADVIVLLRGVEDFYRATEKTSPVPVLLQRARSYLDKDFHAIVAELITARKE